MADYTDWVTKQRACELLHVTPKTLERWAQAGKLQQASWRQPQGGPEKVVYHPGDVARLAAERQREPAPFVLPADVDPATSAGGSNGHGTPGEALDRVPPAPAGDDVLRAVFAAALRAVVSQTSETSAPRLFLTIPEAADASGLPQSYLRRLIREGKLEAVKTRGWRIRRRDLEAL